MVPTLMEAMAVPVGVMGPDVAGSSFCLSTGWGWSGAAQLHMRLSRELFKTGALNVDGAIDSKRSLIEEDVYDALIKDWAEASGRPTR